MEAELFIQDKQMKKYCLHCKIYKVKDVTGERKSQKMERSQKNKKVDIKMVFCYQNCSDLLWEKIDFFLRSLEQFIQTVKGQNNFW